MFARAYLRISVLFFTRRSWQKFFAGKNLVTTWKQLRLYSEQQGLWNYSMIITKLVGLCLNFHTNGNVKAGSSDCWDSPHTRIVVNPTLELCECVDAMLWNMIHYCSPFALKGVTSKLLKQPSLIFTCKQYAVWHDLHTCACVCVSYKHIWRLIHLWLCCIEEANGHFTVGLSVCLPGLCHCSFLDFPVFFTIENKFVFQTLWL